MRKRILIIAITIGFFLIFNNNLMALNKVSAYVDSKVIGIQDFLTLTIKVEGENSSSAEVKNLENLDNFSIISGPNVSTQVSIINGSFSSSKTFTYQLSPEKIGTFKIGPFTVYVNGKTYTISGITIKVVKGKLKKQTQTQSPFSFFDNFDNFDNFGNEFPFGGRRRRKIDLSNDIFLKMEVDKKSVYVGEPLVASLVLYFREPIASANFLKTGSMDGFWIYEPPAPKKPEQENVYLNGRTFVRYVIKKWVLIPTKSGTLNINPWIMSLVVRVNDSFFDFGRDITVKRKSNPVNINVLNTPKEGMPQNFSGLVGDLKLTAQIKKKNLKVGDATTLKIVISGSGNLYTFSGINLESPDGLRVYSPKVNTVQKLINGKYFVEKTFEYIIIPEREGKFKIGGVKIPFFNYLTKDYEYLKIPEFTINVSKGNGNFPLNVGSGIFQQSPRLLSKDINFIKMNFKLKDDSKFLCDLFIFWLILILILLINSGAIAFTMRREKLISNISEYKKSVAFKNFQKEMKKCEKIKEKSEKINCYYNSINSYLKDKFTLSAIEISRNNLRKMLIERGINEETVEKLISILNMCEAAKFVKSELDKIDVAKSFMETKQLINDLEKEVIEVENK